MALNSSSSSSTGAFFSSSLSSIINNLNESSTGVDEVTQLREDIQSEPFLQFKGLTNGTWFAFFVIAVASSRLGTIFPRIGLPLITGYMVVGVFCGPYILNLITTEELPDLGYITQIALSFIAFSAGSELYLPELRSLFRKIAFITGFNALFTYVICILFIYGLAAGGLVSWMEPYLGGCAIGISMIAASIMVARSPASAIAVVRELRAKGPVTSTMLGVTVVGDVVVLILFTLSASIALAQCSGNGFEGGAFLITIVTLIVAVGLGYLLGGLLIFLLWAPYARYTIIPLGFIIFVTSDWFAVFSLEEYGVSINFDSLLICITAGYVATNKSRNRTAFLKLLGGAASYVFIPFFTKVGVELNLKVLLASLPFAALVFLMRAFCIFLGSFTGGKLTGMKQKEVYFMWMTMLAQAGVSLGLASEVAVKFPEWGRNFQTTIIAVVLINQFAGPVGCKYALKTIFKEAGKMKEGDHEHEEEHGEENKNKIIKIKQIAIIGIDVVSLAVAQRALDRNYAVVLFDTEKEKLQLCSALQVKNSHSINVNNTSDDNEDEDNDEEGSTSKKENYTSVDTSINNTNDETSENFSINDRIQTIPIVIGDGQTFVDAALSELELLSSSMNFTLYTVLINSDNDRDSLTLGNQIIQQLHIKNVVARFSHPSYSEQAQTLGIIPIVDVSLISHITMRMLVENEEIDLLEREKISSLNSPSNIISSFIDEEDLKLMEFAMSDSERIEWHQNHPPPLIEQDNASSLSLSSLSAALRQNVDVGGVVPAALRDDYVDRIHAMHNAEDFGDYDGDMNEATQTFLSPAALELHHKGNKN